MLEKAVRICDAKFGSIYRWDGEALHIVATHNTPPAFAEERRRSPFRPYPQSPIGHMVAAKTVVHIQRSLQQRRSTSLNTIRWLSWRSNLAVYGRSSAFHC